MDRKSEQERNFSEFSRLVVNPLKAVRAMFATTRWSLVQAAGGERSTPAREALGTFPKEVDDELRSLMEAVAT
jgi:hypothetical protein